MSEQLWWCETHTCGDRIGGNPIIDPDKERYCVFKAGFKASGQCRWVERIMSDPEQATSEQVTVDMDREMLFRCVCGCGTQIRVVIDQDRVSGRVVKPHVARRSGWMG